MFGKEVESFALQFQDANEKTVRGTTIKLMDAIVESSPVDEGRFRANWFISYGDTEKVTGSKDKSDKGEKTKVRLENKILSQKKWDRFTLTNNLPYSLPLEYGYSDQARRGMVRINVKRFNRFIEQEAKKNMPK